MNASLCALTDNGINMNSLTTQHIAVAGRSVELSVPADPESLLNAAAEAEGSHDPYWGILWDAALPCAECVLNHHWPAGMKALDLGCGAGLVGVAGLMAGLDVTFSDVVPDAVSLAVHNAAANGFAAAKGRAVDIREAPYETFDVLLASDLLYDTALHAPLLKFARTALNGHGEFWLGDPGRQNAAAFVAMARDDGWEVEQRDQAGAIQQSPSLAEFQLLVLRPPASVD